MGEVAQCHYCAGLWFEKSSATTACFGEPTAHFDCARTRQSIRFSRKRKVPNYTSFATSQPVSVTNTPYEHRTEKIRQNKPAMIHTETMLRLYFTMPHQTD